MAIQFVANQIASAAIITAKLADAAVTPTKAKLNETWAFTAQVQVNQDPSNSNDLCRKSYVDNLLSGLYWKEACQVLLSSNVDISGPGATLDGITMVANMRVLLTGQSTGTENGIYSWNGASAAMTRTSDADAFADLDSAAVFIKQGTKADQGWVQTAELSSFASQTWSQFSNTSGGRQAGTGLALSGNTMNVNYDNSSVGVNGSDQLYIKASGITDGMLAGSISNTKLANSSVTVASGNGLTGGGSASLGGSTTLSLQADGGSLTVGGSGVKIADLGVDTAQIAADAIETAKILDANVTLAKLEAVTSAKILVGNASNRPAAVSLSGDATLSNAGAMTIANNAINSVKISDANVTLAKLENVTAGQFIVGNASNRPAAVGMSGDATLSNAGAVTIANNAVTTAKILDANVTLDKIVNVASAKLLVGNGSDRPAAVSLSGDVTMDNAGAVLIANNAINTAKINNANVTLDKLANLTSANFLVGNGTNRPAAVGMSGDATLANSGAITIANNAITTAKINSSAVTASELASNSVITAKIANAAATIAKMGFSPRIEHASGSTATKYDLGNAVPSAWYGGIMVFRNGQMCKKVSSSPADSSEFTIADDGTGGITAVTFGGAPNGDLLSMQYFA